MNDYPDEKEVTVDDVLVTISGLVLIVSGIVAVFSLIWGAWYTFRVSLTVIAVTLICDAFFWWISEKTAKK